MREHCDEFVLLPVRRVQRGFIVVPLGHVANGAAHDLATSGLLYATARLEPRRLATWMRDAELVGVARPGERLADGTWRAVADRAEITRMGEGLSDGGTVAPAALERTIEVIAGMADEAKREGAVAIADVCAFSKTTHWLCGCPVRTARHAGGR